METGMMVDPFDGLAIENASGLPTGEVMDALRADPMVARMVAQFTQWSIDTQGGHASNSPGSRRKGGLFERDRYVTPQNIYAQMRMAYQAVDDDDIASAVADTTEALALSKVTFYAEDKNEEDIYNQIAADLDLDSRLREMWKELFTVSQFYCGIWWTRKTYRVRGKTDKGNQSRKTYTVRVPEAITLLDPLKIVPVGNLMFNQEQLAYVATRDEAVAFDDIQRRLNDPVVSRLIMGRYTPNEDEKKWLTNEGIDPTNLYLLNPANVFRHNLTRPQFRRLSPVRMKPVFELLDMKHQLRSMDRAHLIGGTNFIVLIKKGSDALPAEQAEIQNLQENVKTIARLPVIVGDHRLAVEIITPSVDKTLESDRYATLDTRITARLYGMFMLNERGAGTNSDNSSGLVKVISRGLESRRHMLMRSMERHILGPMFEKNDSFTTAPKLRFYPAKIDLTFDNNFAKFLLDLRAANELSRETLLSQFDLDQSDEAAMLEREREQYDDIFLTQVPFSTPNPRNGGDNPNADPANPDDPTAPQDPTSPTSRSQQRRAGRRQGGNNNGGGSAPGSGQGRPPRT